MSKLLFDESPLVVQPTLAKAIGLNEAIVLQQINYWLNSKGSGKTINGARWIYNTVKEWQEQFPFWSEATIDRTLDNLVWAGLVKTGNYNKSRMDRTKWYTIDFAIVELLDALIEQERSLTNAISQNDQMEGSNLTNCNQSDCTDIPETNQRKPEIAAAVEKPLQPNTPNIFKLYENLGLLLNQTIAEQLTEAEREYPPDWIAEAFKRAAAANVRRWNYIEGILKRWQAAGSMDYPERAEQFIRPRENVPIVNMQAVVLQ